MTESSELVAHWVNATGNDIFNLVRGVSYNKSDVRSEVQAGYVPILRANNIAEGQINPDDLVYVASRYVSPEQFLQPGDVLIAASSGSRSVVGKAAQASTDHTQFAFGAFCTVARPKAPEFGDWLARFTRSRQYREYVESVALGININNFRGSDFKAMPIPIAPQIEQHRIVAKIDSLSGKSKRARDHLDHVPRLVEKYKEAVLRAALRGDLTRSWRAQIPSITSGFELGVCIAERRKLRWEETACANGAQNRRYSDPPPATINGPDDLPSSWVWAPVELIATKVVDGVHKKPLYCEEGVPFLTVRNLTAGPGIDFTNVRFVSEDDHREFIKRTHPENGDILISKDGTLGVVRAVRTDTQFSIFVSVALVKPVLHEMTDFLELAFQSPQVQSQMVGVGTGLQHIHLTDLRQDLIPLPPLEEQREIVRRTNAAFTWIDRLASEATSARKLIDRLDQAILSKAFRGELVPQDPNDEPASVLMERIRAERSTSFGEGQRKRRMHLG